MLFSVHTVHVMNTSCKGVVFVAENLLLSVNTAHVMHTNSKGGARAEEGAGEQERSQADNPLIPLERVAFVMQEIQATCSNYTFPPDKCPIE